MTAGSAAGLEHSGVEGLGAACLVETACGTAVNVVTLLRNGCASCIFLACVPKGSLFP